MYKLVQYYMQVSVPPGTICICTHVCNKIRPNWLYNRAYIIYEEEIEWTSARFLLMKFLRSSMFWKGSFPYLIELLYSP